MRFHYLSDLHLEAQEARHRLPSGDVLIIAGDLCHIRTLEAPPSDGYAMAQRDRVLRFAAGARAKFSRVIAVLGNHDHYEGVLQESAPIIRRNLGFEVLENEVADFGGLRLFGATLWSDFDGGDPDAMKRAGKGCGEFFFVKNRDDAGALSKFRPADALAIHTDTLRALRDFIASGGDKTVVTHHAPSRKGLNPLHAGNGLDGAFATDLEAMIAGSDLRTWVHGHTHIRRSYEIGGVAIRANCRGFDDKDATARTFQANRYFDA